MNESIDDIGHRCSIRKRTIFSKWNDVLQSISSHGKSTEKSLSNRMSVQLLRATSNHLHNSKAIVCKPTYVHSILPNFMSTIAYTQKTNALLFVCTRIDVGNMIVHAFYFAKCDSSECLCGFKWLCLASNRKWKTFITLCYRKINIDCSELATNTLTCTSNIDHMCFDLFDTRYHFASFAMLFIPLARRMFVYHLFESCCHGENFSRILSI